jgi:hypothetical protein
MSEPLYIIPRGLSRIEAAAYIGVSLSLIDETAFIPQSGEEAKVLGWTAREPFGLHTRPTTRRDISAAVRLRRERPHLAARRP